MTYFYVILKKTVISYGSEDEIKKMPCRSFKNHETSSMKHKDLKTIVKEKYSQIARQYAKPEKASGCGCAPAGCCGTDFSFIGEDYRTLEGYDSAADLGLGCGIPTEYAGLKPGHRVLDLGCGAGNDCFVARSQVGEGGWVTGLDFSADMLLKARHNLNKTGYDNLEFIEGDIENMPFEGDSFDVVLSNCVINLVPDKGQAFRETFRVLKVGGHFCFSDVVVRGQLPDSLREDAELYAGCVSGAADLHDYLATVRQAGFGDPVIHKLREIEVPPSIIFNHISAADHKRFMEEGTGIYSLTISAVKPA